MRKILPLTIAGLALAGSPALSAAEITVSITNLTQGMHFTPRLLVAHTGDVSLFTVGEAAGPQLQRLAEGGAIGEAGDDDPDDFASLLESEGVANLTAWQTFGGLVSPATTSADYTFDTEDYPLLSLAAMLIPTNDAFVGLNSWSIPTTPGTYTVYLNAYDSGTEANDEINSATTTLTLAEGSFGGAPGAPGMAAPPPTQGQLGSAAVGVTGSVDGDSYTPAAGEGAVHIHRNALGDTNLEGGISDLDPRVHRWLNPVAKMTITVPVPDGSDESSALTFEAEVE